MKIIKTNFKDLFLYKRETHKDNRGHFRELFIEKFEDGLKTKYNLKVKSFIDFNDVESFCMALKKRETFCSPIIPR